MDVQESSETHWRSGQGGLAGEFDDGWAISRALWTSFMLGNKECPRGFLHAVGARLKLSVDKNWFYLDCVFYREEPNLIKREGAIYPARLDAIVEHENGESVEEEMWKLLMWRAPLKVLIFYDYSEAERANNVCALRRGRFNHRS